VHQTRVFLFPSFRSQDESARISLEVIWAKAGACPFWPAEVLMHTARCMKERPYEIQYVLS
jgi:hypothetical protein